MSDLTSSLAKLRAADLAYYNGTAEMTDAAYDALRDLVRQAGINDPEVQKYLETVGAAPPAHLEKVRHMIHMGSQSKIETVEELRSWVSSKSRHQTKYVMSHKMDGASVEVVYVDGQLTRVSSRGDGTFGSDITMNARHWVSLPHSIPAEGVMVVRGEAIMLKSTWAKHFPGDANPRNTGNGTIMRKSGENNEHITFFAFDTDVKADTHSTRLDVLVASGFRVAPFGVFETADELVAAFQATTTTRPGLDYEIDGVIIGLDSLKAQEELGYSDGGTRPNGQIAWKFESVSAETVVTGVTLTIGSTGAIIPTAQLEPIQVGGITVSNALLNNFDYIEALGVNIGDTVLVERAKDVIPHIVEVTVKASPGCYQPPALCPYCTSPLVKDKRALKCVNDECDGKVYQLIKNWVKKTNIKHLGDGLLTALYDSGEVSTIPDLYKLTIQDLERQQVGQGRLGQSMAEKVFEEIDKTRTLDVAIFMGSLGIKFLGRSMAAHIGLSSVDEFLEISVTELATKPEMGPNKAAEMKESMLRKTDLIAALREEIEITKPVAQPAKPAGGKSFCFSGVRMTPEVAAAFHAAGHQEKSGVSAGLDFLVLKDPASTSSKAEKARSLGIKIISLDNFIANLK